MSTIRTNPWMMPEKPWSLIHLDHAINFMGNSWLFVTDDSSKYPCIHQTSSTSTQATITFLEKTSLISSDSQIQICLTTQQRSVLQSSSYGATREASTPDWRPLASSHQLSRREDGAVFQAVTEEVQAAATTSTTGAPDAVSPYTTQHNDDDNDDDDDNICNLQFFWQIRSHLANKCVQLSTLR